MSVSVCVCRFNKEDSKRWSAGERKDRTGAKEESEVKQAALSARSHPPNSHWNQWARKDDGENTGFVCPICCVGCAAAVIYSKLMSTTEDVRISIHTHSAHSRLKTSWCFCVELTRSQRQTLHGGPTPSWAFLLTSVCVEARCRVAFFQVVCVFLQVIVSESERTNFWVIFRLLVVWFYSNTDIPLRELGKSRGRNSPIKLELKLNTVTHVRLAAVGSASVAAHLGWLNRLSQRDGVGLILFIHLLTVVVLWLAVLKWHSRDKERF